MVTKNNIAVSGPVCATATRAAAGRPAAAVGGLSSERACGLCDDCEQLLQSGRAQM